MSDLAEARAFERIFGKRGVPVTALKGYMGNLASGCGAVDMMVSLIGVNRGKIPPILNCDELDPEMELDVVVGSPRPTENPIFVTTNLTPIGQAAALVIRGCPKDNLDAEPPPIALSLNRSGGGEMRGKSVCGASW